MNKKYIWPLAVLSLLVPAVSFSVIMKGVYGTDNRVETHEFKDNVIRKMAKSVAVQIEDIDLEENGNKFDLWQLTLFDKVEVCNDVRFSEQLAIGQCTGFLVAPDLIVTAGHCVDRADECSKRKWVFDYTVNDLDKVGGIKKKNVYACEKVVHLELDHEKEIDFAIVKLKRQVSDRRPLKLRSRNSIKIGEDVITVGYPSGLPQKVSSKATVLENEARNSFITDLDTFIGNSGSPVINARTYEVEGILVRGGKDYYYPQGMDCKKVFKCTTRGGENCKGEGIQRINNLLPYLD